MTDYRLAPRAARDLAEIFDFSLDHFGFKQAVGYRNDLQRVFQLLAESPRLGRSAGYIQPGVRRHEHRSHIILYEQSKFGVNILALVHSRRETALKL